MLEPIEIRAPKGARSLEIEWSDGAVLSYPHLELRAFCPCAHCQGHQGPVRWSLTGESEASLHKGPGLELIDISEVGNYALRLGFADGHNTGLYSFIFLRALGVALAAGEGLRSTTFGR